MTDSFNVQEKLSSRTGWLVFGIWFAVVSVALAVEVGPHMAPFRRTTPIEGHAGTGVWELTHVLAAGCECSRTVAQSLVSRGPDPAASNRIVMIGRDDELEASLAKAGFAMDRATAADAYSRYGIHGAPWLFVHRPDGTEAYSGGYAPRRPILASDVRSADIVSAVRSGRAVDAYPAFGCIFQPTTEIALEARK